MDKWAKVAEMLKKIGDPKGDIFFYAEVTKITGDTCSAKVGDLELTDVRLRATDDNNKDKLMLTPKINSKVIVGANHGDLRDLVVIKVDDPAKIYYKHNKVTIDIDGDSGKIKINGGDLGGLIKIEELVKRFNKLEDYVKNFKTKYDAHVHLVAQSIGAAASPTQSLIVEDPESTQRDPLEDKNVTH